MQKDPKVTKYVTETPAKFRRLMIELRENIHELFPQGEEVFAYNIPVYRFHRKPIFSIAVFKDHYSLVTQDKEIAQKIPELGNFKISGTTVHFTTEKPLTRELLREVITQRLADRS